MIYFYYGSDSYRAKQTVNKLKEKFLELYDPSGTNIEFIDPSEFSLERFFNSVKASGFLSTKKFIVIKNVFTHKLFKDAQDPIINFLKTQQNTKEENYLVFWHEGVPRSNTKLFKYLMQACAANCSKNFEQLKGASLIKWVQSQAHEFDKTIDANTATLLLARVGDDTWMLHNEIKKISHTISSNSISIADVDTIVSARNLESIFPLVDALGERDKNKALQLLENSFYAEQDPLYLLSMITRQFRLLLMASEAKKLTQNSYAIAQQLGLPPFIAAKIIKQSMGYDREKITSIYSQLLEIDLLQKSDPKYVRAALTLLVSKL